MFKTSCDPQDLASSEDILPYAVMIELIVAAKCDDDPPSRAQVIKYLRGRIAPHLRQYTKQLIR